MIHIVFIEKDGYTEFSTSHTPNRTGSEPGGAGQAILSLLKVYKHFTLEVL
jgi:hypothetical protein